MRETSKPRDIDEYVAARSPEVRAILERIRAIVQKLAPRAKEKISYQMPAFSLDGDLIYFAAFKNHIGLYPPVRGDAKLQKEIAKYAGPKGNLKFPLDEPIPYELIRRVVRARLKEHREHIAARRSRNKGG